ncbi:hypothetical protein BDW74DRAFT_174739 [Aspergillus multicolor]|uniref:fungal specific transcription factor domain-containing protein n=1 Tax=Aspergillus multicolor TaxID=41759 RepID=UPI003CCD25DF
MTEIVDFAATCPNPDIVLQEPWSEAPLAFGKFRFLERFTSVTGFVSSFECMRIYEVRQLAESVAEGESEDVSPDLLSPTALDYLDLSCLLSAQSEIHSVATPHSAESFHSCASLLSDPLATVTSKLVSQLKRVTVHRGPGTPIALRWSPANERVCYQFFDSRNIRRYLAYYWSFWYPNCPIIHKPTFNVHRIPLTLLLPMLLVGSMFDPDESITQTAKLWFNSAEELVFADDNFHCDVIQKDGINRRVHNRSAVQALQGAYLMCLLQNWEGDDIGKRRIRRARFGMVTAIARELGFSVVRDYQQESDHTCWADFVAKEEFNRTLSYILLLDTAFVIFNNCPPKITISELSFLPVCPESCFQAETEAECFLFLFGRDSTSPISQLAIAGLISRICQGELDDLERGYIVGLGKLNLFIIVSGTQSTLHDADHRLIYFIAIHTLLFHARNTLTIEAAVAPIQRGLANWKVIWQQHEVLDKIQAPSDNQTSMQNSWKRTGFIEYAPEYWTLAHAIIVSIQQQIGASSLSNTVGATSNPNSEPGALLCRFDENDMKQLNRFIHSISNSGLLSVGASPKDL